MSVRRTDSQVMTSTFAEERRETARTLTLCLACFAFVSSESSAMLRRRSSRPDARTNPRHRACGTVVSRVGPR